MKIDDIDFCECESGDMEIGFDGTDRSFLLAVRGAAHAMCRGEIPGEISLRLGLLFSAVAKLAITSEQAVAEATKDESDERRREIHDRANFAMAGLCAAAASWAEVAIEQSNTFAQFGE